MNQEQVERRADNTQLIQTRLNQAWHLLTCRLQEMDFEQARRQLEIEQDFVRMKGLAAQQDDGGVQLEEAYAQYVKATMALNSQRARDKSYEKSREIHMAFHNEITTLVERVGTDTIHPTLLMQIQQMIWSISSYFPANADCESGQKEADSAGNE